MGQKRTCRIAYKMSWHSWFLYLSLIPFVRVIWDGVWYPEHGTSFVPCFTLVDVSLAENSLKPTDLHPDLTLTANWWTNQISLSYEAHECHSLSLPSACSHFAGRWPVKLNLLPASGSCGNVVVWCWRSETFWCMMQALWENWFSRFCCPFSCDGTIKSICAWPDILTPVTSSSSLSSCHSITLYSSPIKLTTLVLPLDNFIYFTLHCFL